MSERHLPKSTRWQSSTGRVHFIDYITTGTEYGTFVNRACGSSLATDGTWLADDEPLTCRMCIRCRGHRHGQWPYCDEDHCHKRAVYEVTHDTGQARKVCRRHLARAVAMALKTVGSLASATRLPW